VNPSAYDDFTEELRSTLAARPEVLGLILLGSTADPALRDEWSDHDFWVIVEPGAVASLEEPSWLPRHDRILLSIDFGPGRRTVLYRDGHKVEYAVFDPAAAGAGKIERYSVAFDRGGVGALAEAIHRRTVAEALAAASRPDGLPRLCEVVWTATERHLRGEHLSARRYLDDFGVDRLLALVAAHAPRRGEPAGDLLDPRRRLERRHPELASELRELLALPVPAAAARMLRIARREVAPYAPGLAWREADEVLSWIEENSGTSPPPAGK
jgi:hypothetical protein